MSKKQVKTDEELLREALVPVEEQPYEIPSHWKWVRLSTVCEINPSKLKPSASDDTLFDFLPMAGVSEVNGSIETLEQRYFKDVRQGFTQFKTNDILFAKITPCMENGKCCIVGELLNEVGYGSTEFYVFRTKPDLYNRYLYRLLRSELFRIEAKQHMSGAVGQQRVPKKYLEEYLIPLPPLDEQKRIAGKIERMLDKINQSKQLIEEAKQTFELRRSAILEKAFSGELVGGVTEQKNAYPITSSIKIEIPHEWEVIPLKEVVEICNSDRKPVTKNVRINGKTPYYGATGVVDYVDGFTHDGDYVLIGEDGANLLSRSKPQAYQISGKSWVNNHAHVLRGTDKILNKYIEIYLNYIPLNDFVTGTAQPKLNRKNLEKIPVVVPPIEIQTLICKKIGSINNNEDEIASSCTITNNLLINLDNSILSKAFKGEL